VPKRPYDLAIVGNGVAASATLIALGRQRGARIAVVAPARTPPKIVVGEQLSTAAVRLLDELGLLASFRAQGHVETHASFASWGQPGLAQRSAIGDPRGAGWSLDRARFDRWLQEEAQARCDAEWIADTVVDFEHRRNDGLRLELRNGSPVDARFVVDASGRAAVLARRLTARKQVDRLIAIVGSFDPVDPGVRPTAGTMIEAMPAGWLYSALLPEGRFVVAWFGDADLLDGASSDRSAVWREHVEASRHTRERIRSAGYSLHTPAPSSLRRADASTAWCHALAGSGWAAVGDAAAAFDPLSSHGLATSLWSGARVARELPRGWKGELAGLAVYDETFASGVALYLRQRRQIYAAEGRFADEPFWRRRRAAIDTGMTAAR